MNKFLSHYQQNYTDSKSINIYFIIIIFTIFITLLQILNISKSYSSNNQYLLTDKETFKELNVDYNIRMLNKSFNDFNKNRVLLGNYNNIKYNTVTTVTPIKLKITESTKKDINVSNIPLKVPIKLITTELKKNVKTEPDVNKDFEEIIQLNSIIDIELSKIESLEKEV